MGILSKLLGGGVGPLMQIIDKVIPDPNAKREAQLKLLELEQSGELRQLEAEVQLALGQLAVNKAEAESGSLFKGGWRPAVGWICAFALGYQMLLRPVLAWISGIYSWLPPPSLELDTLLTLLFGLLGLGAMRTAEKFKGVAAT
jgi:hypothetical protein